MRDEQESKNLVGRKASFIVRVTSRQNATWQGSISWTERGVTKHFPERLGIAHWSPQLHTSDTVKYLNQDTGEELSPSVTRENIRVCKKVTE